MSSQLIPNRDSTPVAGLYVVETLFTVLAIIAVCLRLWARRLTKRPLAFTDWAAIIALVRIDRAVCVKNGNLTDA